MAQIIILIILNLIIIIEVVYILTHLNKYIIIIYENNNVTIKDIYFIIFNSKAKAAKFAYENNITHYKIVLLRNK